MSDFIKIIVDGQILYISMGPGVTLKPLEGDLVGVITATEYYISAKADIDFMTAAAVETAITS